MANDGEYCTDLEGLLLLIILGLYETVQMVKDPKDKIKIIDGHYLVMCLDRKQFGISLEQLREDFGNGKRDLIEWFEDCSEPISTCYMRKGRPILSGV